MISPTQANQSSAVKKGNQNVQKTDQTRYVLIALGVIGFIGSLVACGCSYSYLGLTSFAIIGGGTLFGIGCLSAAQYCIKPPSLQQAPPAVDLKPHRIDIFIQTLLACKVGYIIDGKHVTIDHQPMLEKTETLTNLPKVERNTHFNTKFFVDIDDTLNVLLKLKEKGHNPVGINMANRWTRGGGVKNGCPAQEEAICRRTNHILGLETQPYPIPEFGCIYSPHVSIFREDEANKHAFMKEPQTVALVAVAAYDLRETSDDRKAFENEKKDLILERKYQHRTKKKIRTLLRAMASKGHTHIVLGALGCGAFRNPPEIMAILFEQIFKEKEFQGCFEEVHFAILKIFENDQANVDAFSSVCERLFKP